MEVTIDGYDPVSRKTIPLVHLWYDYNNRAKCAPNTKSPVIAVLRHGDRAEMIERKGNGCQIATMVKDKVVKGWLTYWFVKELKGDYVAVESKAIEQ